MVMRSSGQRAPLTDSPVSSEKPSTLNSVPGRKVEVRRAGQQRAAFLRAAGQQRRQALLGKPAAPAPDAGRRDRRAGRRTRRPAPARSRPGRAPPGPRARRRSCPCPPERSRAARPAMPMRARRTPNRNRRSIAPASTPSVVGMADAAVGGDDARAGDLALDARRAEKISAEQDDETAHGDGLYHAAAPKRKGVAACLSSFACAAPAFVLLLHDALTGCRSRKRAG